jgi:hypothetical protein
MRGVHILVTAIFRQWPNWPGQISLNFENLNFTVGLSSQGNTNFIVVSAQTAGNMAKSGSKKKSPSNFNPIEKNVWDIFITISNYAFFFYQRNKIIKFVKYCSRDFSCTKLVVTTYQYKYFISDCRTGPSNNINKWTKLHRVKWYLKEE